MKRAKDLGFTLIELMVVVAIALIVTILGFISLTSRTKLASLEQSAQQLASDLTYSRSAAMLKGCPSRIVFCPNATCTAAAASTIDNISLNNSATYGAGSAAWTFYAILRQSSTVATNPCYNSNAIPIASDGWTNWDYDRRPQKIPTGIRFNVSTYSGATAIEPDQSDWSDPTSAQAANSIYFRTDGVLQMPGVEAMNVTGSSLSHRIVFQTSLDHCDPDNSSEDCAAFLVGIPRDGGVARFLKCNHRARSALGNASSQPSQDCLP